MSQFIIRIELHGIEKDHKIYSILHKNLEKENILTKMYHIGGGTWHTMPHATYYTGTTDSSDAGTIQQRVRRILNSSIHEMSLLDKECSITGKILVVQAKEHGYPLATDYPLA
jgi:hypothetical protein